MSGSTGASNPTNDDLSTVRSGRRGQGYSAAVLAVVAVLLLVIGLGAGITLQRYVLTSGGGGSSSVTISETGSSLIFPLFQLWGPAYEKLYPNVNVAPVSSGSGTGISSAEAGTVDIGGTDAYINGSTSSQYHLLDIATAISALLVFYNLPGVSSHINLNGTVIAMIYDGAITMWNDPLIQAANPGVSLPAQTIVPIHRSDGSGDTYMFTQFCYLSWKGWPNGYGTTVPWIKSSPGGAGNSGMVTTLQNTKYGIAYIGISYKTQAVSAGLQYAALGDQAANVNGTSSANYVLPTPDTISQDANLGLQYLQPPSLAISLILGGVPGAITLKLGAGGTLPTSGYPTPYPIVNLENLLIPVSSSNPSHVKEVVQFLGWALSYGQSASVFMTPVNFLPLTPAVIGYDMLALQGVSISS
ncbi:MAG: phosphate ABC transporter substrate-binding protein PstS [Thermoplasmata archaeon]